MTESTMQKCEHGNRISPGDTKARYCSGCNSDANRILAPMSRVPEVHHVERTMDAAEFIDQPAAVRLAMSGGAYESYT